jgi:hypothetical protein
MIWDEKMALKDGGGGLAGEKERREGNGVEVI